MYVGGSSCPLGCSETGGAHCLELIPTNVDASLFVDTGELRIGSDTRWDTGSCASLPGSPMTVTQVGGPELCVVRTARFSIESGSELRVQGPRPLVILASEYAHIDGDIDVSANGTTAGPGGSGPGTLVSASGGGLGESGRHTGTYADGGGGGGGMCGPGGAGGSGSSATGGAGGAAAGASSGLSPLRGGWGGGRGGTGGSAGAGGGGGGAVQISVRGLLRVRGAILAGGGGGNGGLDGVSGDDNIGAGGGGGSGGAVLLEAESIVFESGGFVRANGGGGGGASSCHGCGNAEDGTDGRDHATRPPGGARGASSGFGEDGGDGGGSPLDGAAGGTRTNSNSNGGGGGGGAGCVYIHTEDGSAPGGLGASSPSVSPGLTTDAFTTG